MLAIVKFAVWFFLILILAAFVILALQLFGFFIPLEYLNVQVQSFSDLLQEAVKIPENQEKIKKFEVKGVENITKEDNKICIYGEKDYRCLENVVVNVVFLNKTKENVKVIKPGSYVATITKFNVIIEEI
jgi:amino acid transporter